MKYQKQTTNTFMLLLAGNRNVCNVIPEGIDGKLTLALLQVDS